MRYGKEEHKMFIMRNGEKIELTEAEVEQAYREQDLSYHILDIKLEWKELYGEDFPYNEQVAKALAERAIHFVDNTDMYWKIYWDCFHAAIREYKESVDEKNV